MSQLLLVVKKTKGGVEFDVENINFVYKSHVSGDSDLQVDKTLLSKLGEKFALTIVIVFSQTRKMEATDCTQTFWIVACWLRSPSTQQAAAVVKTMIAVFSNAPKPFSSAFFFIRAASDDTKRYFFRLFVSERHHRRRCYSRWLLLIVEIFAVSSQLAVNSLKPCSDCNSMHNFL